jgi:hypothetical protein
MAQVQQIVESPLLVVSINLLSAHVVTRREP